MRLWLEELEWRVLVDTPMIASLWSQDCGRTSPSTSFRKWVMYMWPLKSICMRAVQSEEDSRDFWPKPRLHFFLLLAVEWKNKKNVVCVKSLQRSVPICTQCILEWANYQTIINSLHEQNGCQTDTGQQPVCHSEASRIRAKYGLEQDVLLVSSSFHEEQVLEHKLQPRMCWLP